jgi:hypothetical protein
LKPEDIFSNLLSSPEKTLFSGIVLAMLAGIGWLISHAITARGERRRQQLIWQLDFTSKQLQELYGPLSFMLAEGQQTFKDLLTKLGRSYVFPENGKISREDLDTWLFWAEKDFMPRNRRIQELLASKAHLIEGPELPDSYSQFLKHSSAWEIENKRWVEQQVEYSWRSSINWPKQFELDVSRTFSILKTRHSEILGKLTSSHRLLIEPKHKEAKGLRAHTRTRAS